MADTDDTKTATNGNDTTETKKAETEITKDLESRIIRQIEYYFGDINLPRDKFLQEQITLDDGWVPLTVLLTFKRLAAICSETDVIAKVLAGPNCELMEVSEDKTKVRRNPGNPAPEYNEERRKELISRTAYAKGFSNDDTLETVMKFIETYGPYESVVMRSYKDKALNKHVFKGSIFVIFKDVDACKSFIEKDEVKYNDNDIIRKWQADYIEGKRVEREERNSKRGKNKNIGNSEPKKKHTFPKGAILHMTGFKDDISREMIKEAIVKINEADPAYITFDKGDTQGYIRFADENGAVDFLKKLDGTNLKVGETDITVRALEGEEEEKFLAELSETIAKARSHNKHFGKGKHRKRRGGADDGPRNKQQKN